MHWIAWFCFRLTIATLVAGGAELWSSVALDTTGTSLRPPVEVSAKTAVDTDGDGINDPLENELGSNPNDTMHPDTLSALTVVWFVDNAGLGVRLPPITGTTSSIVTLHNNRDVAKTCLVEYYTQDGVYVGPAADRTFAIPAGSSIAFRPVADDPATVVGGQEAPEGQAVPNRPVNTLNGNDGKKNGSIVVRWIGEPSDVQGACTLYSNTDGLGPQSSSYVLPPGARVIPPPATPSAPCSLNVPWYVDNAGVAVRIPPTDGMTTSLVFVHNNTDATIECTIEYYTQNGVYVGPFDQSASTFAIAANSSLAFRPVAHDPASTVGGQEAPPGLAVPNRPVNMDAGNDGKRNGSIVIRWTGQPTDVQGFCATYGNPNDYAPVTAENPSGQAPYSFAHTLPAGPPPATLSGEVRTLMLPGGVPLEMVWIAPGKFPMGRYPGEQDSNAGEDPQHDVTIDPVLCEGFWLAKYELTKRQWLAVMGTQPWLFESFVLLDLDSPAVYISWDDAQAFLAELSMLLGGSFRLPSEAEWEYACRAGTTTRFHWGDDPGNAQLDNYAWHFGNAFLANEMYAHAVGQKLPNPWGLYDMNGNVVEWCQDWYDAYAAGAATNPTGPATGTYRVVRNGSWNFIAEYSRSAARYFYAPTYADSFIGFRVAR